MADWIQVIVQTLITVVVLFVLTRLMGKRQIIQLSLFEYITGITIGNLAAHMSLEMKEGYLGFISLLVWVAVILFIHFLQLKSKTARDWLDGKDTVLIKEGKVLEDNLKKERITIDELMSQLRKKNVFKLSDVEFAVMEPNGIIDVMLKKECLPLTPKMLGLKVAEEREPEIVIMDGSILDEALFRLGRNRRWLKEQLEKQGVQLENVFVGQVDSSGELYLDVYDDKLQLAKPQEKPALLATLKKCEADLEMFALSTEREDVKAMYGECAAKLEKVIDRLKPYLTT
ncbi:MULTISPECIES: DUF421 domain-containing protein [Thermoactinomyces]|jgi:uncharacterized membrane protein YcaP (DUF421 family)|uniref:DUF421 domain-containing protein n=1 Tax=Thermoactinomyces daqus TaxID=1329516 RepID=A0A7W2AH01_9BACL|nr:MULTISPECIES: DUF421 domain-containing protein [Thermoactinomyces]MBA4542176.1 DUF421 domain-containing protein [Thermoactinomyces daqus]MBH8598371.1 DUF421 domain-containing protein [Thermoactinomyces sp. CICC 10523]MBH8604496.1 DUF421 domain-containing protein [Thermoactinomyces sp. CICC 10522]MBH8607503.1 DUF421 domain-containing protein [Thermoactinomyces sp. CICC 10521]